MYSGYINTTETDPTAEMEEYAKYGRYNSAIGDFLIPTKTTYCNTSS